MPSLPLHFHSPGGRDYKDNYDQIFRKEKTAKASAKSESKGAEGSGKKADKKTG